MSTAYIALGSNLGPRRATLQRALVLLNALPQTRLLSQSSFHETDPVDAPAGSGPFLNAVAALETTLDPTALLERLLDIEKQLGRDRSAPHVLRNGPRTIDLDLLLLGDQTLHTDTLTLPHPRLHLRRFVLAPLAEIAPDLRHPTLHKTIRQLLAELPTTVPATPSS